MRLADRDWGVAYASDSAELVRDFYIPALQTATHYARETGYFSSTALAVAAEGFSALFTRARQNLIARPAVRLLTSAQLTEDDYEAMSDRELTECVVQDIRSRWDVPADLLICERLHMLAWLLKEGYLEIRIGIPLTAAALYHPKVGLLVDEVGERLAFSGSLNESAHGWTANIENFHVFGSWRAGETAHVAADAESFERRWTGQSPMLRVLSLPDALRQELLTWIPAEDWEPTEEPFLSQQRETSGAHHEESVSSLDPSTYALTVLSQDILTQFQSLDLVSQTISTSPLTPWPHQVTVLRDAWVQTPIRRLLCDEVGLGKTIEVALIVRSLKLRGEAERVLFAVPAGLMRQWQEQLWSKGGWDVPFYERGTLTYRDGSVRDVGVANPLDGNTAPWIVLSKSLLSRKERRPWVDASCVWDVVVVDEAHNLRREDFKSVKKPKPNLLLQTFLRLRRDGKFRHELLLTATPMQMDPIELFDLLRVLGIDGPWSDETWFRGFYGTLAALRAGHWEELPWLLQAVQATLKAYGMDISTTTLQALGGNKAWAIEQALQHPQLMAVDLRTTLTPAEISQVAASHTPLQRVMSRHTRSLLKEYFRQGLTKEPLPERQVQDVVVPMSREEQIAYQHLEAYFVQVYRNAEMTKKGLGFMKTLYLRRLTSSLAAAHQSLIRRFQRIRDGVPEAFETIELEAVGADPDETVDLFGDHARSEELARIQDLLHELDSITTDSKFAQLRRDLDQLLLQHRSAIVFTQYTDSLDHLRERLVHVFGKRLACYSGRGGERWDGVTWVPLDKSTLLEEFRLGETLRILLCTDAASEGFDLQSCSVLINYDMPWNPMRVEQRIGRIDRIGQQASTIQVHNYYYQDSVDQLVYQALRERLDLFVSAVGPLQAVLGEVDAVIGTIMAEGHPVDRRRRVATAVERLQQEQERLAIAEQTLALKSGLTATTLSGQVGELQSRMREWVALYGQMMGHSRVMADGEEDVADILLHGQYQLMTANPAVFDKYSEVAWFDLGRPDVRQLVETWASIGRPNKDS